MNALARGSVVLLFGAIGCVSTIDRQDYLRRNLAPKAAFDLQCPESQLDIANLGPTTRDRFWPDGDHVVHVAGEKEVQRVFGEREPYRQVT